MTQASAQKSPQDNYENLKRIFAHMQSLFHIKSILGQDMMTVMPKGGIAQRIKDITNLTKRIYADTINPRTYAFLEGAENDLAAHPGEWAEWDKRNLKEMRWIYDNMAATPPELFVSSIHAANEGRQRHMEAVTNNDWASIAPWLEKVLNLQRHILEKKQERFGTNSLYETALYLFVRDVREEELMGILDRLADPLRTLADEILTQQNARPAPQPLAGTYTRGEQMQLNHEMLEAFGFDFLRGTLSVTNSAPSAGGHGNEARILVRCEDGSNVLQSVEDTLYHGAVGLYIQGLPEEWLFQPVGNRPGLLLMVAHSILVETIIGRTPQFMNYLVRTGTNLYPHWKSDEFEAENIYQLKKIVRPAMLRQESDELTRFFHDLMRTRIERDLVNGTLAVKDLPERWNEESKKFLKAEPKDMASGLLQSSDWFIGSYGYYPLFILSYITATQLQDKLFHDVTNFAGSIEKGEFGAISGWLRENIYSKARSMLSFELVEKITGLKPDEKYLINHIKRRYLGSRE